MHVPEAHAITTGSKSVLVGDIDTGIDWTHPDLAPNVDFANSASCVSGAPDTSPDAYLDDFGHGTHTAGTIAAAANGVGITGVAPGVRIAAIKATDPDGFIFPEMIVCAFMWAASHHMDVTNNSYFVGPWYFNCKNDPGQHAIWKAEQRAIRYAMTRGVTVVAATGNFSDDLAHPTQDVLSPDTDFPDVDPRRITNACAEVPGEIPGVIGVSATGPQGLKSSYSNYGVLGVVDVAAPGGDYLQATPEVPSGDVLSTVPYDFGLFFESIAPDLIVKDCSVSPCAYYAYFEGTSMAAPHATGLVALAVSRFGKLPPGKAAALVERTADPTACPPEPYFPDVVSFSNGAPQVCRGGPGYNGFYGHGQVNAYAALTR